jgi:hypothetical protein
MKSSTKNVSTTLRLAISTLLILGVSVLAGQFALFAQSKTGASPRTASSASTIESNRGGIATRANVMAEETASYIETGRIPIKPGKGELFTSRGEEAFLVSSVEKLGVSNPGSSQRKIVSVINYKNGSGKSAFYVIDAEVKGDSVVYQLKRDSRVLQSFAAKLIRPTVVKGPGVDPCKQINKDIADLIFSLQSAANQSCQTRGACVGYCSNFGATTTLTIIKIEPKNPKCFRDVGQFTSNFDFGLMVAVDETPHGPLLNSTLWTAARNDSTLFY